ncbi:MAG: hypothetical protein ACYC8T_26220, partial [Myxococcaceae bacterium]
MRPSYWLLACTTLLFTTQALAAPTLFVRTNDGLALGFDAQGSIQSVSLDASSLPSLGAGGF